MNLYNAYVLKYEPKFPKFDPAQKTFEILA